MPWYAVAGAVVWVLGVVALVAGILVYAWLWHRDLQIAEKRARRIALQEELQRLQARGRV